MDDVVPQGVQQSLRACDGRCVQPGHGLRLDPLYQRDRIFPVPVDHDHDHAIPLLSPLVVPIAPQHDAVLAREPVVRVRLPGLLQGAP